MTYDEDEEQLIGDEDDFESDSGSTKSPVQNYGSFLVPSFELCNCILPKCEAKLSGTKLSFIIPLEYLPLSLQMVCGFHLSPKRHVVEVELNFQSDAFSWKEPLEGFTTLNPLFKKNYVGRPLVDEVIKSFFQTDYRPRKKYQALKYINFLPNEKSGVSESLLSKLVKEKFPVESAKHALLVCKNNITKAREFLLTGQVKNTKSEHLSELYLQEQLGIDVTTCPLIYLIIEIVEVFLDLSDHCCICRKQLPFSGIKPSTCDGKLCVFRFNEIGIGTSVIQEIQRDRLGADLMISIFACAMKSSPKYLNPAPPKELLDYAMSSNIFTKLPRMNSLVNSCNVDSDISKSYGNQLLDLLRWILLSNKSQIISLPNEFRLQNISNRNQFMTLIASPQAEQSFLKLKKKHGSIYMWHGSGGDRWHSIIRNGLLNMSKRGDVLHGTACGPGIYLAKDIQTSLGYSQPFPNPYSKSELLPSQVNLIALCEIAKVPSLKDFNNGISTLQDEEACIVRFIFTNDANNSNSNIGNVPTLKDVLEYIGKKARR